MPKLGMNSECLPAPPATMMLISAARSTTGNKARSSSVVKDFGHAIIPHMPPSLSLPTGMRAFS
jgi:hypothetical protein